MVLMALLVFLLIVVTLIIGCCSHKPRKRKVRKIIVITNPSLLYANPSGITPVVMLQGVDPSTQIVQNGDSDDSNSTGSIANSNSRGRHLLPAPPIFRAGSSRRIRARSSRHSRAYSSGSDGRNRTPSPLLSSGENSGHEQSQARRSRGSSGYYPRSEGRHQNRSPAPLAKENSGSERQTPNRGRQARSSQRSGECAPRSNRRHRSFSPNLLLRDRLRYDRHIRNHHSDNAARSSSSSRSSSRPAGHPRNAGPSRERPYRRGSGSEQWGSLSSDGRPELVGDAAC